MKAMTITGALIFALILGAGYAKADIVRLVCGPRDMVKSSSIDEFQETVYGGGLAGSDAMIELWINPGTQTYTVTIQRTNGKFCILGGGKHWEQFKTYVPGIEY